ncbi:hypothetical protein DFP72DRAFT_885359 [Ephemerocybe angulata]|uniref:Uncharacterized protein n=1 Tax=Ephemerocybe angulata TaxID=980116 RepID=A0A8H6I5Z3_9AGAR|nr:hypothetical protein DFP72DRAFT_885359 [Tulosesus angulatus]
MKLSTSAIALFLSIVSIVSGFPSPTETPETPPSPYPPPDFQCMSLDTCAEGLSCCATPFGTACASVPIGAAC